MNELHYHVKDMDVVDFKVLGDVPRTLANVSALIGIIYRYIPKRDEAEIFRRKLLVALNDPNSLIWDAPAIAGFGGVSVDRRQLEKQLREEADGDE